MKLVPVLLLTGALLGLVSAEAHAERAAGECQKQNSSWKKRHPKGCSEVTIAARAWTYQRLFSFIDALDQDVAATQLAPLLLSPNASNGSQLDAVLQSFQVQAGYSQSLALQNQGAAQMLAGNVAQQSSLLQQQSTLLPQYYSAEAQLTAATNQLTADQAAGSTPSQAAITADQLTQSAAQTLVTNLTTQLSTLGSQMKTPTFNPSFTTGTGSPANTTAAPTALSVGTFASPNSGTGPSFPATKQMDNQFELLWERLSRVLETMVKPDSADPSDQIYLVEFNTGVFPVDRKRELLDTEYILGCEDEHTTGTPVIVDMFPRVAAVNITDTKFRDNQTGFGLVLSWLGIGLNASYNKEHMQYSQMLGQSSYITGYGVGGSRFGWEFGIPIGDDQISPDTRKTFAMVSVPAKCNPTLTTTRSMWMNAKGEASSRQDTESISGELAVFQNAAVAQTSTGPPFVVKAISFNRQEFDPTTVSAANPVVASVYLQLDRDIDQQTTITANGILIKRARDTFTRAVSGTGTQGLLEASQLAVNTWIPVSARNLILNLDGQAMGNKFPDIVLTSPAGIHDLTTEIISKAPVCPVVTVSGLTTVPGANCMDGIPSLAFQKSMARAITGARVLLGTQGQSDSANSPAKVMFTDLGVSSSQTQANAATSSGIRVVSGNGQSIWSELTEVYYLGDKGTSQQIQQKMRCTVDSTTGNQLLCYLPNGVPPTDGAQFAIQDPYHVLDTNYTIGAVKGWAILNSCGKRDAKNNVIDTSNCYIPTFYAFNGANPADNDLDWNLEVDFVNVGLSHKSFKAKLGNLDGTVRQIGEDQPVMVTFTIKPSDIDSLQNSATLQLLTDDQERTAIESVRLTGLSTSLRPLCGANPITPDPSAGTTWSGSNLLGAYTFMKIGNGSAHAIACNSDNYCQVKASEDLTKDTKGNISLLTSATDKAGVVLMTSVTGGFLAQASFTPAKPATTTNPPQIKTAANTPAVTQGPPTPVIAYQLLEVPSS